MTERELDCFLREPSMLEKFNLIGDSDFGSISPEDLLAFSPDKSLKTPPFNLKEALDDKIGKVSLNNINRNAGSEIFDEDSLMPPGQDIAFYMHPRYGFTGEHRHSFIELIYVYSGECRQTINKQKITMHKGELCILDTNTFHSIEIADEDDIIINCLMRKSYFNAAFLSRLSGNDLFTGFFVNAIYQSKDINEYILLHSEQNEKISRLMKDVLCEYFDKGMCSEEVINSYMIILFAEMLRVYKSDVNRQNFSALKNTKLSDIIHYVQCNYKTAALESTARHFNFDGDYLSKALKKLTRNKFMDLVHQARLGQACILLKSTDLPVNEIANAVGYENINFFYQIFKRHYSCSPAQFRKSG